MIDPAKQHQFEVVYETLGRSVGKLRNEISISWLGAKEGPWEMATDEENNGCGEFGWPPSQNRKRLGRCLMASRIN